MQIGLIFFIWVVIQSVFLFQNHSNDIVYNKTMQILPNNTGTFYCFIVINTLRNIVFKFLFPSLMFTEVLMRPN